MHYKKKITKQFLKDAARTRELHAMLVVNGSSRYDPRDHAVLLPAPLPLRNVDRRDLTAFLFLEAAAKFEGFCFQAFAAEVRAWYKVTGARTDFVMGSPDNGTLRTMGWSDPQRLEERGSNLFPAYRFFGAFRQNITPAIFDRLGQAKKIRNRIAHDPAIAHEAITKLAQNLNVPSNGMTMGRLLSDYPLGVPPDQRYFFLFLGAFESCARAFSSF